jgi:hypothetical protein
MVSDWARHLLRSAKRWLNNCTQLCRGESDSQPNSDAKLLCRLPAKHQEMRRSAQQDPGPWIELVPLATLLLLSPE